MQSRDSDFWFHFGLVLTAVGIIIIWGVAAHYILKWIYG